MLRVASSAVISPCVESSSSLLTLVSATLVQSRGRRRTLTPAPWLPPVYEKNANFALDKDNKVLVDQLVQTEKQLIKKSSAEALTNVEAGIADISEETRRVGLLGRKIGMLPQWTVTGERMLCTLLEIPSNHVTSVTTPEDWYRRSIVGKRKAFNREGPMHKVTVGAVDGDSYKFTQAYRRQFIRAGIPVKKHLGGFLVTEDALPPVGIPLDARHFSVGQYLTATGKSIDWGFQGGMHRWGMRGQPSRRTTKSHRRIGSVGSVGDARIWPGKRMPGHMGYEWVTTSGLEIVRINTEKQVIYIKGCVPGDVGEILLLKDCLQPEKKLKNGPMPTWTPSLETIPEETEETETLPGASNDIYHPSLFRFTSPSIQFSDADAKRGVGRDKTKAKIAKVKK